MSITRQVSGRILALLLTSMVVACGESAPSASTTGRTGAPSAVATQASIVPPTSAATTPPTAPITGATPTAGVKPTNPPALVGGSAMDAITAAYQASAAAKSYRAQSTVTGENSSIMNSYEIVKPDRLHVTTNIKGRTSERIYIGPNTYARANAGEWIKSTDPADANQLMKQFGADAAAIAESTKNMTEAKVVGPETLNGKPMTVYQYNLLFKVNDAGANSTSITKLWVGADKLPYKLESDGSTNITGAPTTSHTVTLYSDYNADIKIDAPIQ